MLEEMQALRAALEMSRKREQNAFQMVQEMRAELDNAYRTMGSRDLKFLSSHMLKSAGHEARDEGEATESRSASPAPFDASLDLLSTELSSAAETEFPSRSETPCEFDMFMISTSA